MTASPHLFRLIGLVLAIVAVWWFVPWLTPIVLLGIMLLVLVLEAVKPGG